MKSPTISDSKIEYLHTAFLDVKEEPTAKGNPWLIKALRLIFNTLGPVFPTFMARQAYNIFLTPRWRAKHTRPDDLILSAQIRDFAFEGETIKVYEWGHPQNPIVLLAHGWESRGTALRMYVPDLVARGFRVVAYDAIAHGDSTGQRNNLPTNARTLVALIKDLGGIYAAIGHSFGCGSLSFALQHVEPALSVEKMVFIAVPHATLHIMQGYFKLMHVPPRVQKAFMALSEQKAGAPLESIDVAKAFPAAKVGQLLLVHDKLDRITSIEAAEKVVAAWDNAKLLVTQGFGHYRLAKNPDVIQRIVDFIVE